MRLPTPSRSPTTNRVARSCSAHFRTASSSCHPVRAFQRQSSPTTSLFPIGGIGRSFLTSGTAMQSAASTSGSTAEAASSTIGSFLSNILLKLPSELAAPFAGIVVVALGGLYWKYRGAIQHRLKSLKESWIFGAGVTMERIYTTSTADNREKGNEMVCQSDLFANLRLLELNPDFKKDCQQKGWRVYSLGDYLSSLRPKQLPRNVDMNQLPNLIQREVEAGLAAGLLKALGPNLGRALLPVTGLGPIKNQVTSIASDVVTNWFLSESGGMSESNDKGGIPISLMTLLAASDLNARFNSGKDVPDPSGFSNMQLSPIEKMMAGEVVKGPSFACAENDGECMIPQETFVVSRDFDSAIATMERKLSQQKEASGQTDTSLQMARMEVAANGVDKAAIMKGDDEKEEDAGRYDPDDQRLSQPVPINPRLFPGLHLGYGNAISSHTKREILKMRLLATLLNRLGSNYYKRANGRDEEIFSVAMNEDELPVTTPSAFIQKLIDTGHNVEVVPTTHLTTFGVNICVKEDDGSWSNIPLAGFVESGYEDKQGRGAPAMLPHSGLDMFITGPLAGKRKDGAPSTLQIQHFHGIEGYSGWNSNDHPVIPFNVAVECGPRLHGAEAADAARIAGLYASVLNGLSTELKLPFGGYGLTAVCNDSAALVQQCLYGKTTIYPLTSVGRFLGRAMRYSENMAQEMAKVDGDVDKEVKALLVIADSMKKIPNDLNASPATAENAAKRMLATMQPTLPFLLAKESRSVVEAIIQEEEEESEVMKEIHSGRSTKAWR